MLLTKEIEIDMAHRLPFHKSKCRNLHWHRYKIEATVEWEVSDVKFSSDFGMIIDYWDLKQVLLKYIDTPFDHWAVFYKDDVYKEKLLEMIELWDQNPDKIHFVDFMPTAENLCKYWFEIIEQPLIKDFWITLKQLKVWETPTSTAIYTK